MVFSNSERFGVLKLFMGTMIMTSIYKVLGFPYTETFGIVCSIIVRAHCTPVRLSPV